MSPDLPILRRSAKVSRRDGRVVITYLDEEISLAGAGAELLERALPHLDGDTSVGRIAELLAESVARVRVLTDELHRAGVLAFAPGPAGPPLMSGEAFYDLHRRHARAWLRRVYQHPLWEKLAGGTATRAQVIGFAFEKYHYIEAAHEHMGIAAANATPEMMPHLARHFVEEYGHGDIYRRGLQSLFRDELVLGALPLPSTRALVNLLAETAAQSSFAYYAGNEVLQLTENTGDRAERRAIDDLYAALRRHYPFTERLIASFLAHTHADQRLGHEGVFREMCASAPPLGAREVREAMNVARSMVEHLVLFLDGIEAHYARWPAVPRLAGELLSE